MVAALHERPWQTRSCCLNAKMAPVSDVRVGCACALTVAVWPRARAFESAILYESWNGKPAEFAVLWLRPKRPLVNSITLVEPFDSITRTPGQRSSEIVTVDK